MALGISALQLGKLRKLVDRELDPLVDPGGACFAEEEALKHVLNIACEGRLLNDNLLHCLLVYLLVVLLLLYLQYLVGLLPEVTVSHLLPSISLSQGLQHCRVVLDLGVALLIIGVQHEDDVECFNLHCSFLL